jgi:BASS family bile acid:Na+ symporter
VSVAALIPVAINLSLALIVLAVGLQASLADATYLLRHPRLLVRSLLAMNVIMPVVAAAAAALLALDPAIELAIIALALSPIPPLLPHKQSKAGGTESYIASLLVTMAVVSIVVVPLGIEVLDAVFDRDVHVAPAVVLRIVGIGIILPLMLGLAVRRLAPEAERMAGMVGLCGFALLVGAFLPVLVQRWPLFVSMVGNGALLVLVLFACLGLAVGHVLGGPVDDNRAVLALATATRHPGVAIAIATAADPTLHAVMAVVLWHLVVGAIVSIPYVRWRARTHAAGVPTPIDHTRSMR